MIRYFLFLTLLSYQVHACTGITLTAEDGSIMYARTLEFGTEEMQFNLIMIPRNTPYVGSTPDGKNGKKWTTKYAIIGASMYSTPYIADAVNEKGFSVGLFYFPGYAKYDEYIPKNAENTLAQWELATWLLSSFATVKEAIEQIDQVDVVSVKLAKMGISPPIHYVLHDDSGACVVMEFSEEGLHLYDNPLGVITNSPTFDWQTTNLGNYINLSATNKKSVDLGGNELNGFGMGTGLLGLPGDFTPTSRFVRATALSKTALPVKTGPEAMHLSFHILDSFDIPRGAIRDVQNGKTHYDSTQFTSCTDLKKKEFYFHTYDNRCIRMISLDQFDLDKPGVLMTTMQQEETIPNLSNKLVLDLQ